MKSIQAVYSRRMNSSSLYDVLVQSEEKNIAADVG